MARILYSAKKSDGSAAQGFVDAPDMASARDKLMASGLVEVAFHQELVVSEDQAMLSGLSEKQQSAFAKFRLDLSKKPGLHTVLRESARQLRFWMAFDSCLLAWGLWSNDAFFAIVGFLFLVLPFVKVVWLHRHADRYDAMLRAFALGRWDVVKENVGKLRSALGLAPLLAFDLEIRMASIQAREGKLSEALASLEHWRGKMADKASLLESRLAAVHAAAGDRLGFLAAMDKAYVLSRNDPSRALDLALGHARVGDLNRAKALLNSLDESLLPELALPFLSWAKGLCQQREKDPAAVQTLTQAVEAFIKKSAHPAVWTALAFCMADHALALAADGQGEQAKIELESAWSIVGVHADAAYLQELGSAGLVPAWHARKVEDGKG